MRDLIQQVRAFRRERDWEQYHSPKNLVMALAVEAAELAEHFQWLTQEQSRTLPPETLAEVRQEIGDVLGWCVVQSPVLSEQHPAELLP